MAWATNVSSLFLAADWYGVTHGCWASARPAAWYKGNSSLRSVVGGTNMGVGHVIGRQEANLSKNYWPHLILPGGEQQRQMLPCEEPLSPLPERRAQYFRRPLSAPALPPPVALGVGWGTSRGGCRYRLTAAQQLMCCCRKARRQLTRRIIGRSNGPRVKTLRPTCPVTRLGENFSRRKLQNTSQHCYSAEQIFPQAMRGISSCQCIASIVAVSPAESLQLIVTSYNADQLIC